MFQVQVEWCDEDKSRARFSLPGREEWKVEHITALMQLLADIREQMTPAVPDEPPQLQDAHFLHAPRYRTVLPEFSGGSLIHFRHPSLGWLPVSAAELRAPANHGIFRDAGTGVGAPARFPAGLADLCGLDKKNARRLSTQGVETIARASRDGGGFRASPA
jgi:hypothetical protein